MFKYWHYITCISCDDLVALEREITKLLELENGCHRLSQMPELSYDPKELTDNPGQKLTNLWIVGLFLGASEWTIIHTFPKGLFCRRAFGTHRPRLSQLTVKLSCNAFHLEVHDGVEGFLLEADTNGRTFLSGCPGVEAPDDFQFYEEQVDLPDLIEQFSLIAVPKLMQKAMKINEDPEVKRKKTEADHLMKKTEPWDYEEFSLIEEAYQGHTERIDRALAAVIDSSKSYWHSGNLADKIYNEPENLKADDIKLLYFHPPILHKPPVLPKIEFPIHSSSILEDAEDKPF